MESTSTRSLRRWLPAPFVILGLLVRLAAASRLPPHLDEGNMLLGIHAVAEHGYPLLPSGVVYLHGVTISYLLAPFHWLGWAEYTNLFPLRATSALFGALAVYLGYRVARSITGSDLAAAVAAGLIALDPLSVVWGGFIRMYALLQVLVLVVAWLLVRLLAPGADTLPRVERRRLLVGLVVAFWLAVFTQIVAALLWPAMALAALVCCGRGLLGRRRDLTVALGACLAAPLAFLAASTLLGEGSGTARSNQAQWLPAVSFLGNDRLDPGILHAPDLAVWAALFPGEWGPGIVPLLLIGVVGLLLGRYFLAAPESPADRTLRNAVGIFLLIYWAPILALGSVGIRTRERYLLHVQAIGYILAAVAVAALWAYRPVVLRWTWAFRAAAVGLVALLLAHTAGGLWTLTTWATDETDPGLGPALAYVAAHRAPGEWAIIDAPPEAALVLGETEDIRVIGRVRTQAGPDGAPVDDRIGWPVLTTSDDLCTVLTTNPGTWIVQGHRLEISNEITAVLAGAADEVMRTPDDFQVLQARPLTEWEPAAQRRCGLEVKTRG